jgi:hypothetical protein
VDTFLVAILLLAATFVIQKESNLSQHTGRLHMKPYRFWTYILTNWDKTVLYTGVTNNLAIRLIEHWIGIEKGTGRFN